MAVVTQLSDAGRARWAREVMRTPPDRLVEWQGIETAPNVWMNPYRDYAWARRRKQLREHLICDLLIGDLVLHALLHPSLTVGPMR